MIIDPSRWAPIQSLSSAVRTVFENPNSSFRLVASHPRSTRSKTSVSNTNSELPIVPIVR